MSEESISEERMGDERWGEIRMGWESFTSSWFDSSTHVGERRTRRNGLPKMSELEQGLRRGHGDRPDSIPDVR